MARSSDGLGDQYDPRAANGSIRQVLMSNTETRVEATDFGTFTATTRTDTGNTLEIKEGFIRTGAY